MKAALICSAGGGEPGLAGSLHRVGTLFGSCQCRREHGVVSLSPTS